MRLKFARMFCFHLIAVVVLIGPAVTTAQDSTKSASQVTESKSESQKSESKSASSKSTDSKTEENEAAEDSLMKSFEKQVDAIAGQAVGALASVMFYEILGHREFKTEHADALTTVEGVRSLIEEAEAAGITINEADLVLTLPHGSLSKDDAKVLQKELSKQFTLQRALSFSVKIASEGKQTGTSFSAVEHGFPIVVLWLVLGAIFFTLRMNFINLRAFKHAILVTAGKYDNPDDKGEVSHFQALTAALSATVGLGNIAGVAIAVATGGPGATFWMVVAGLLGMTSKFTECTLGQKYREVRPDGRIMGGAMHYLSKGLEEMNLMALGKFLGVLFAVMCVMASFGGGNAFQVNQSARAVEATFDGMAGNRWIYGLIMTVAVGVVIIGGIKRIASTAEKIVPLMCGIYVLACLWILMSNAALVPNAIGLIVNEAFTPQAGYGGLLGVLIMGFRRAAFSNEAGVGSAAIAHSAAKTEYPVREGIVALLEPFIDTVIVCSMTALVIVVTGAYDNPAYAELRASNNGAGLTSAAMGAEISWFPYVLSFAVVLFAYSTMISWSYYGERCFVYLFGDRSSMTYRIIFLAFVFLGSIMSATNVLDLSDLMILGMAFPNILGVVLLSGKVRRDLDSYWEKHKNGEFNK